MQTLPQTSAASANSAEKQVNFKPPRPVLAAFDAVCAATGVSRTETLVRLMTAHAAAKLEGRIYHLDGTLCPLASACVEITKVMRSTITTMTTLAKRGQLPEES